MIMPISLRLKVRSRFGARIFIVLKMRVRGTCTEGFPYSSYALSRFTSFYVHVLQYNTMHFGRLSKQFACYSSQARISRTRDGSVG